eukprot:229265_1
MMILALLLSTLLKSTISYNIDWSPAYMYFNGGTRNPYLVDLRGSDPEFLLICFEEIRDDDFSGICKTAKLDITNSRITFSDSQPFQDTNASDPYEIQIFNQGPTPYFLLAYTNGESSNDGPGEVLVGSFDASTGSIIYGDNVYEFNPRPNDQSRLIELQSGEYAVICSSAGPVTQYDTECRIAHYNTYTLTMNIGTNVFKMTESHPTSGMVVERIASNGFLACFVEYIQRFGACYVGTVSWSTNAIDSNITFSNEIIFHNDLLNPIDELKLTHVNETMLTICYTTHILTGNGGNGICRYVILSQVSGYWTVSILPQIYQFVDHEINSLSLFHVDMNALYPNYNNPELIVICYVDDGTDGYCKFAEIDLDTNSIIFEEGVTENFHPTGTRVGSTTTAYLGYGRYSGEANYLVICYTQFSGSTPLFNKGYCRLGTITTDSIK